MTAGSIAIPEEALQAVVAHAIVESVTPAQREDILLSAVTALITPPAKARPYDPTPMSPLQAAFDNAARAAVNTIVRELVSADTEFLARIRAVASEEIRRMIAEDYRLEEAVMEALTRAIIQRRDQ